MRNVGVPQGTNLLEHLLRTTDAKQRVRGPASGLWSLLEMCPTFSQGALLGPKDESGRKNARRCRRTPHCVSPLRHTRPASSSALMLLAKLQSSHVVPCRSILQQVSALFVLRLCADLLLLNFCCRSSRRRPCQLRELLQFGPDFIHRRGRHPWTSSMPTCSSLMTRQAAR